MSLPRLNDFNFKFADLAGNLYQGMAGTVKGWFDARGTELQEALNALAGRLEELGVEHIAHNEGGVDGLKIGADGSLQVSGDGVNYTAYPSAAQMAQAVGSSSAGKVTDAGGASHVKQDTDGSFCASADGVNYTKYPSAAQVTAEINARVQQVGAADMAKAAYDPGNAVAQAGGIPAYVQAHGTGNMKEADYDPDGDVLDAGGIPDYVDGAIAPVTAALRSVTVTIAAADWQGDSAPYSCTKPVHGMAAGWVPAWRKATPQGGTLSAADITAAAEALGMVQYIESSAGALTFICPEDKPETDLTVMIGGALV